MTVEITHYVEKIVEKSLFGTCTRCLAHIKCNPSDINYGDSNYIVCPNCKTAVIIRY